MIFLNSGNQALELFLNSVKKQIANHPGKTKSIPKNVCKDKETIQAIKELSSCTVIRLFDNGRTGFFVLDKEEYIRIVEVALDNQSIFKRINNPSEQIQETSAAIKFELHYTNSILV